MSWSLIFIIAFALSLDAFAVSVSCGIKLQQVLLKKFLKIAFVFGAFQIIMPLLGRLGGELVRDYIEMYDHWITFFVFLILGMKTLMDSFRQRPDECPTTCQCLGWECVFKLALATSIDALAIGVVFSLYNVPIVSSVLIIGITTFAVSLIGLLLGTKSSRFLASKAGFISGSIMILISIKVLMD